MSGKFWKGLAVAALIEIAALGFFFKVMEAQFAHHDKIMQEQI